MAGHSKWANIKHKKSKQDAKRGKIFTKLIREITVATKVGGPDESSNPRLRAAISKALDANMTRDTINRAVKKASSEGKDQDLEEIRYEGYAPGGVAVIIYCLTNNKNRTVSEVRHAFSKFNGNLGTDGSVSYMFTKAGQIIIGNNEKENEIIEIAINEGAQDVTTSHDNSIEIITEPNELEKIKQALINANIKPDFAEVSMIPENVVELDLDASEKVLKLIDHLEDLDDVQSVYTNANFDENAGI